MNFFRNLFYSFYDWFIYPVFAKRSNAKVDEVANNGDNSGNAVPRGAYPNEESGDTERRYRRP